MSRSDASREALKRHRHVERPAKASAEHVAADAPRPAGPPYPGKAGYYPEGEKVAQHALIGPAGAATFPTGGRSLDERRGAAASARPSVRSTSATRSPTATGPVTSFVEVFLGSGAIDEAWRRYSGQPALPLAPRRRARAGPGVLRPRAAVPRLRRRRRGSRARGLRGTSVGVPIAHMMRPRADARLTGPQARDRRPVGAGICPVDSLPGDEQGRTTPARRRSRCRADAGTISVLDRLPAPPALGGVYSAKSAPYSAQSRPPNQATKHACLQAFCGVRSPIQRNSRTPH